MNPNLLSELLTFLGPVVQIVETAPNATSATSKLRGLLSNPLVAVLEQAASVFYPQLAPELHLLSMLSSASVNTTMLVQEAINIVAKPNPPLAVDGKLGPKTKKAIMDFQAKHGLNVTGFVADAEWAVIQSALAKK